jgi:glycosyltransferase involved in cell wall biosynthesis
VLSATPKASLLALLAARVARVPVRLYSAVGLRLEGAEGNRRRVLAGVERLTTWAATDVVANSPSLAARYRELRLVSPRKIRTTTPGSSHGVDTSHYRPQPADDRLAQELGLDLARPVVGFVGRLTHDKGIDALLAAMVLLEPKVPGVQYLVVGPQDEPDSEVYLRRLSGSTARVVATGPVTDVRPYFSLMDVHVLPTLREGFPNVVLEASAMEVPTVTTTATGSVDSVVPGVTGLLVPCEDPTALAEALQTLAVAPDIRTELGRAARKWVTRQFQPEDVVRSLLGRPDAQRCPAAAAEEVQGSCA